MLTTVISLAGVAFAAPEAAWGVVIGGASDRATAEGLLHDYRLRDLPSHADRPRVMSASSLGIAGDKGFVVLIGASAEREVAEVFAEHLQDTGLLITVEPIKRNKADDLRLLLVDSFAAVGQGAPLHVYGFCIREVGGACIGRGRVDAQGRVLVPFLPKNDKAAMELIPDAGNPWICEPVSLGPWHGSAGRWLRGPSQTACKPAETPRERERL